MLKATSVSHAPAKVKQRIQQKLRCEKTVAERYPATSENGETSSAVYFSARAELALNHIGRRCHAYKTS
jgi:hypothetical protein